MNHDTYMRNLKYDADELTYKTGQICGWHREEEVE